MRSIPWHRASHAGFDLTETQIRALCHQLTARVRVRADAEAAALDVLPSACEGVLGDVVTHHVMAGDRHDLRDAGAHDTSPEDTDAQIFVRHGPDRKRRSRTGPCQDPVLV
jgi:hypothetical protein